MRAPGLVPILSRGGGGGGGGGLGSRLILALLLMHTVQVSSEKIRTCIIGGTFGSRPLHAYHGVKRTDFVFTDEEQLQTFLELNEEGKMQFSQVKYTAKPGEVLTTLQFQWEVDEQFEGDYRKDYQSLHNELIDDVRTAWADKYTAAVLTRDEDAYCRRYELQPIPTPQEV